MNDQLDFNFQTPVPNGNETDGIVAWRETRRREMHAIAMRHGLPLGHRVRVEFKDGPYLEGVLLLDESAAPRSAHPVLHVALRIGDATFDITEIGACVRLE